MAFYAYNCVYAILEKIRAAYDGLSNDEEFLWSLEYHFVKKNVILFCNCINLILTTIKTLTAMYSLPVSGFRTLVTFF